MEYKITFEDNGVTTAEEIPRKPATGEPYFKINKKRWDGKWFVNDACESIPMVLTRGECIVNARWDDSKQSYSSWAN